MRTPQRFQQQMVPAGTAIVILSLCCLSLFSMNESTSRLLTGFYEVYESIERSAAENREYQPAGVESYLFEHASELGYDAPDNVTSSGCAVWKDNSTPVHSDLHAFKNEVQAYTKAMSNFSSPVPDLRQEVDQNPDICNQLGLGGNVLSMFPSQQLSLTTSMGYIEPILPPLRHPMLCEKRNWLMSLGYLVHDFPSMCRSLKRSSRTVFIDMGASLEFHGSGTQPAVYLTSLYSRFGIPFDHIYAFEITPIPADRVFKKLPDSMRASYHWMNVGVSADPDSHLNPWNLLRKHFTKDDFVVVKLDIDTSTVELPLVKQLLEDEELLGLVDQFYFEHHVMLTELKPNWRASMKGSVFDSMTIFQQLRQRGVASHYWV